MQCLYCDTQLKPFRGFFDEDFCCRDHRDKYSSSFRKALTGFGGLDAPAENLVAQTTAARLPELDAPAPDPLTADFQPIAVVPWITEAGRYGHQPELLAVCCRVEIPNHGTVWSTALDCEGRTADLLAPAEGTFAVVHPAPALLDVSAPSLIPESGGVSEALSVEAAGPAAVGENDSVPGYQTAWIFAETMALAPAQLSMPWLAETIGSPFLAPIPSDEYSELALFCAEIRSTPILGSEIALVHETKMPAFTPACETLQSDDPQQPAEDPTKPYWGELYSDPEPAGVEFGSSLSVAPEMAWRSVPVDRPVPAQGNVPVMMPPSLELASARSANVTSLSPAVESQPQLAPELAADFADGDSADSSAVPHSHEPLKLTFGNLVKIKNWRLRITFAKPA